MAEIFVLDSKLVVSHENDDDKTQFEIEVPPENYCTLKFWDEGDEEYFYVTVDRDVLRGTCIETLNALDATE